MNTPSPSLPDPAQKPSPTDTVELRLPPPAEMDAGAIPEVQPAIKPIELERNLDRAKENLIAYLAERNPSLDLDMVRKAIEFTLKAHHDQFRHSGMPYAEHPFEVAKILGDLNLDATTIAAGLLHDVVEDTSYALEDVRSHFGEEAAFLVEAVTKISLIQSKSRAEQQAETFRKMLISMAKDIRVIMIKFADRLHNMRTLGYMLKEDRKKAIAAETLEVYAPLAHRFGLARIRWELEDLAFKTLNPDAYRSLVSKVVERRQERENYIRLLVTPVREMLDKAKINGRVFGRPKHLYSIWQKMQDRGCQFEDIYDLYAIRVVVDSIGDCYATLGQIHQLWTPLQSRFKDYIATPKPNMYQSLHTSCIGPLGKPIEVQIRTEDMDRIAEEGIAAHWAYKEGSAKHAINKETKWLNQFLDLQQELTDSSELMEYLRGDLAPKEIFVFTPKGDLVQLPKGSTSLDFAFALHSGLGVRCIGAKIDGEMATLDRELETGERVEILKSDNQHPSKDWLNMVATAKAKHAIRRWLRTEETAHSIQLGKEILEREFRQTHTPQDKQQDLKPFAARFAVSNWEQLWEKIGHGEISLGSLSGFVQELNPAAKKPSVLGRMIFKRPVKDEGSVLVSGMSNMLIRFATCCNPVPGDRIIGYVTRGRGVSIHRANCAEGQLLLKEKDRIIPVQWKVAAGTVFDTTLEVAGKDRPDLLRDISEVLSKCRINIQRASIVTVRDQVRNRFRVQVADADQLDEAIERLKKLKGVTSVARKTTGA